MTSVHTDTTARTLLSTASMPVDPGALLDLRRASESSSDLPELDAACAGRADLNWVPDVEDDVVPDAMRRLCATCPGRLACLQWAATSGSTGYWGGTTSGDRRQLAAEGRSSDVRRADQLQAGLRADADQAAAQDAAGALHLPGEGSLWWYRRGGCRCRQCRGCNSKRRAEERSRSRTAAAGRRMIGAA